MKALRSPVVTVALMLTACATGVTQDLPDEEGGGGGSAGMVSEGGTPSSAGKTSTGTSGTLATAGTTTTNAFGGTATTAGSSSGGKATGGSGGSGAGTAGSGSTGGKASGGSGGASTAGSGGKASGGSGGSTGSSGASGSGGSGGSVVVGTGSCDGTAAFVAGTGNKYAKGAKVTDVCMGGTPCTLAMPAGTTGKTYEFSCLDQYNCGAQDPGSTNWSQPPWQLTTACTP